MKLWTSSASASLQEITKYQDKVGITVELTGEITEQLSMLEWLG